MPHESVGRSDALYTGAVSGGSESSTLGLGNMAIYV